MAQSVSIFNLPLTQVSRALMPQGMIAGKILTPVTHPQYTGVLPYYGKEHLRIESTIAGAEGKYRLIKANAVQSDAFNIETYGLRDILYPKDYANYVMGWDLEADRTTFLTMKLRLAEEQAIASVMTDSAILTVGVTLSGSDQYSHSSGGDPIGDFQTARQTITETIGVPPNKAIVPYNVMQKLLSNPALLDVYKYTNPKGLLTQSILQTVLGGEDPIEVLVPRALKNNSVSGQTDSIANVWGKHIVFFHSAPSAGLMQQTLGYKVSVAGANGGRSDNSGTSEAPIVYRNPIVSPPNSTELQVERKYDDVIVDVGAAYLIKNAIA